MKNTTNRQIDRIAKWLESGKPLTPMQALEKFGCFRLSARIKDLRDSGTAIVTEIVHKNGKNFASYRKA